MDMFSSRHGLPSAWIIFALPRFFPKDQSCQWVTEFADLNTSSAVSLELKVLLASPEADWPFLVKVRQQVSPIVSEFFPQKFFFFVF